MRKYINGVLLSSTSLCISIISTMIVYRELWSKTNTAELSSWIAIFELAQFFLLADIGFTHKYIRDHKKSPDEIENLRGRLLATGALAGSALFALASIINHDEAINSTEIVYIAASTCITLFSYADAAELRAQERFTAVYPVQILSQIGFLIFIFSSSHDRPTETISIGILLRSILLAILQTSLLRRRYRIKFSWRRSMDATVVALNGSYFILFLLDGVILVWAGTPNHITASALLIRKYFDIIRGFSDSALQVYSKKFSNDKLENHHLTLIIIAILSIYALASTIAHFGLIELWIGKSLHTPITTLLTIGISGFSISIFRWISSAIYFGRENGNLFFLIIALTSKLAFCLIVSTSNDALDLAYATQAIIIIGAIAWHLLRRKNILHGKIK